MSLRALCLLCAILLLAPVLADEVPIDLGKNISVPSSYEQLMLAVCAEVPVTDNNYGPNFILSKDPGASPDSSESSASVPKVQGSEINLTAGEFKEILNARIEPTNPDVHDTALFLVAKFPGDYTIDQICSIYDYLKYGERERKGWSYVRDPRGEYYFNYANESLWVGDKRECSGAGDCDDFAILISSLEESIGGTTRIILAYNNSTGAHAYTEVYLGRLNPQDSQVIDIIEWLKRRYNTDSIFGHIDPNTTDVWLNLDWGSDNNKNGHPGGPFYQGDRHMVFKIRETFEKTSLKLLPTKDEKGLQSGVIPLKITMDIIESNSTDAWFNKGFALNNLGKYEEAIEAFDTVIDTDPSNTSAWNNKGYALNNLGRYEDGLWAFENALKIDPDNALAWSNKAWALNNLGRYEDALQASENALEIDQDNALAWNNKASALNYLGRYEDALQASEKALEIDPNNALAWLNRAITFMGLGRIEDALQATAKTYLYINFTTNNETNPKDVWFNKGLELLYYLSRPEEAIEAFDKVIYMDPGNTSAWNNKGYALNNLGRYKDALWAFENALEIDPNNPMAWSNKGYALNSLGRYEDGLQAFEKVLEIDPNNAMAWNNKGYTLNNLGRYEDGLQACEKALEIDPNNVLALNNKAWALKKIGS